MLGGQRAPAIEDKRGEALPDMARIAATASGPPHDAVHAAAPQVKALPAQVAGGPAAVDTDAAETAAAKTAAADTAAERNDSIKDSAAAFGESVGATPLAFCAKILQTIKVDKDKKKEENKKKCRSRSRKKENTCRSCITEKGS